MKQTIIFFASLLLAVAIPHSAKAYSFSAVAPTGQTLYYNIVTGGVEVTSEYYSSYTIYPTGVLTIPSSVTYNGTTYTVISIGEYAFHECGGLTSVTIPDGVTSIGNSAFYGCSGLTSVTIGNGVTSIGERAFQRCSGLTSTIPDGVTSIGNNAFNEVRHIEYHGSATGSPWGAFSINGVTEGDFVYSDDTKHYLLAYVGSGGAVTIPSTVNTIGRGAFYYCSGLTSITIPDGVTSIGERAFQYCSGLTSVTIPDGVTSIGSYAFHNVRHIEYHGSAWGSPWGAFSMNGVTEGDFVYSDDTKHYLLAYVGSGGAVTIPSTVDTIGRGGFYGCSGLTSITIPDGVTSIGNSAFYGCSGLTSVTIGNGVTSIGEFAFYNCSGLTSVTIPDGVTSIGNYAFYNCSGLTSVTIGSGVTSIGMAAFYDCIGLTSVTIGSGVTSICNYAFYGCSGLTSVTIPDGVTSIGNQAFYFCSGLTSVTIGSGVTSIGERAFYNCSGLNEITSLSSVAPYLGTNAFNNVSTSIPIYIPCGSSMSYSSNWNYFSNFVEVPAFTFSATTDDTTMGSVVVVTQPTCDDPTAVINAVANYGYLFDYWSDGSTDNPRTLTLTQDTSIIAMFEIRTFTVVANNSVGGGTYPYGSTAMVFALPQVDLQFAGWSDGETANPRYIVVTSDTTLTALYRAPDTVRVYDTTTVYDTVINIVYDTTEYNHYYYDTTRVYDTMVYVNIDTLHHYYYDTTRVFDTLVNIDTVNHYFFDTTLVYDTVVYVHVDTLHYYQYDTTYIIDTLVFYDTTSETHYVFDSTWVYDSVWVFDSVYITDTVYFFDTVYIEVPVQGIDGVEMVNVKVYTHHNRITVEGAEGMVVRLYDVNGRLLATKIEDAAMTHLYVQASGTYLVRVGDLPARRVVVIM